MKVVSPNGMINQPGSHHRRPAALDRNGRRKDDSPASAVGKKNVTQPTRRRQPRQGDDPMRGHLFDMTT